MELTRPNKIHVLPAIFFIGLLGATSAIGASVKGTTASGNEVDIEIIKSPALEYPRRAQRLGVEGYVLIGFDLSPSGEILDLRVVESKPRLMFDKAAMKFVENMKFAVPEEDGASVSTQDIKVRVTFALQ